MCGGGTTTSSVHDCASVKSIWSWWESQDCDQSSWVWRPGDRGQDLLCWLFTKLSWLFPRCYVRIWRMMTKSLSCFTFSALIAEELKIQEYWCLRNVFTLDQDAVTSDEYYCGVSRWPWGDCACLCCYCRCSYTWRFGLLCMFKSVSQLIRLFNIEEYGRVQGICIDMPTTSPSLILWCMDWDWGRIIANVPVSAIAESKCAQDDTVGNQQVLLDATVEWNQWGLHGLLQHWIV